MVHLARVFYTDKIGFRSNSGNLDPHSYTLVGEIEVSLDSGSSIKSACEELFVQLNMGSGRENKEFFSVNYAWDNHHLLEIENGRSPRSRSMSVGDVIAIGESFYLCAVAGFEELPKSLFTDHLYDLALIPHNGLENEV